MNGYQRRRAAACFVLVLTAASAGPAPARTGSAIPAAVNAENSVVKIFAKLNPPAPYRPWTRQAVTEVTGSGVVIEGHRILTTAHLAAYASEIQIQANQSGDRFEATVAAIGPRIDLAFMSSRAKKSICF